MSPTVLFVDDCEALRDIMKELLRMFLAVECRCLDSLQSLKKHSEELIKYQLAIIDINLGAGQPSGIDVYRWLIEKKFKGKIIFLTGHARAHPLVSQACSSGAMVLEKPVENDLLVQIIKDVLRESECEK